MKKQEALEILCERINMSDVVDIGSIECQIRELSDNDECFQNIVFELGCSILAKSFFKSLQMEKVSSILLTDFKESIGWKMDKTYFEMNEAEKQVTLIDNNLDYAICVLSEGLQGTFRKEDSEEIRKLQDDASTLLAIASSIMQKLLEHIKND